MSIEDINQEDYFIMIQNDFSIKIGKNSSNLSPPKLTRTTAGEQNNILSISDFSLLFQKLYKPTLTSDVNNVNKSNPFLSYADKNTINDIDLHLPNVNNNIPTSEILLPIVVDNNSDLDLSMDKEEVEKIKHQLVKPKLTRQYENVS